MPVSALRNARLVTGTTNPAVARNVAKHLGIKLTPVTVKRFSNGEIHTRIEKSVRAKEVYVLATANTGRINDDFMETKILLQTLSLASVRDIFLLMYAMPYLRQDRKDEPRVPITAVLAFQELYNAARGKMQSLITFDPHPLGAEGFMAAVGIPAPAALSTRSLFVDYIQKQFPLDRLLLIPPDITRTKWIASIARKIYGPEEFLLHYLPVEKVKFGDKKILFIYDREVDMEIKVGKGKKKLHTKITPAGLEVVIGDDMIDGGGTVIGAAEGLVGLPKGRRPASISAVAAHGYFSGKAPERLQSSPIDQVIVANTLDIPESSRFPKLEILDTSQLVAEIIHRIMAKESLKGYNLSI